MTAGSVHESGVLGTFEMVNNGPATSSPIFAKMRAVGNLEFRHLDRIQCWVLGISTYLIAQNMFQ